MNSRIEKKMLIKELIESLQDFEDDNDVSVFLELTPNYGIMYEVEDWVNNKGHLNIGISDSVNRLTYKLKSRFLHFLSIIIITTDRTPSRKNRLYPLMEGWGWEGVLFITIMLSIPIFPALSWA